MRTGAVRLSRDRDFAPPENFWLEVETASSQAYPTHTAKAPFGAWAGVVDRVPTGRGLPTFEGPDGFERLVEGPDRLPPEAPEPPGLLPKGLETGLGPGQVLVPAGDPVILSGGTGAPTVPEPPDRPLEGLDLFLHFSDCGSGFRELGLQKKGLGRFLVRLELDHWSPFPGGLVERPLGAAPEVRCLSFPGRWSRTRRR